MKNVLHATLLFVGVFCFSKEVFADSFVAQTFGGATNDTSVGVVQTVDGGYVIGGPTSSFGQGGFDLYLAKFRSTGELDSSFGTAGTMTIGTTNADTASDLIATADGGFAMVGTTYGFGDSNGDIFVVKITSTGEHDTAFGSGGFVTIGGDNRELGNSIIQTSDGGYMIVGLTESFGQGGDDIYIAKLTSTGVLDTSFGMGGTVTVGGTANDSGYSVIEDDDGGFVFTGWTANFGVDGSDMYVFKLTSTGVFDTSFGSNGDITIGSTDYEYGRRIIKTSDGGFMVLGYAQAFVFGHSDIYMAKLTSDGSLDTTFNETGTLVIGGEYADQATNVLQTSDNGYLVLGSTSSIGAGDADAYIIKLTQVGGFDTSFNSNGTMSLGNSRGDSATSAIENEHGNYVVTGYMRDYGEGGQDAFIMQITPDGEHENCIFATDSGGSLASGGTIGSGGGTIGSGGTVGGGECGIGFGGVVNTQCIAPTPGLTEITPITSPTTDSTPNLVINANAKGTLMYGGSCKSSYVSADVGSNTVTYSYLENGSYSDCTIILENVWGINSSTLPVTPFTVEMSDDEDITTPHLTDLSISTNTIDTTSEDQEVVVTFTATDDLSGLCFSNNDCINPSSIYLESWERDDQNFYVSDFVHMESNRYSGTIIVPRNAIGGVYGLVFELVDKIGNTLLLESVDTGGVEDEEGGTLFEDQNFTVTNSAAIGDGAAPQIIGNPSVDPFSIDLSNASQTITVTFEATDDISGVCVISEKSDCKTRVNFGRFSSSDVERISGDKMSGVYSVDITISQYSGVDDIDIKIGDFVGNSEQFEYGSSSGIFENITDPIDTEGPQLVGDLAISPTEVDTSTQQQKVTVTFRAVDNLSGVCEGDGENCHTKVWIGDIDGRMSWSTLGYVGYAERISGDKMDGTYKAEIVLPQYARLGSYDLYYAIYDMAGNDDKDAEDFIKEDAVINNVGEGSDEDDGETEGTDEDDSVIGANEKDEVEIPKPDMSLTGKLKDLVLSSKKKIYIKRDEIKFKGEFKDLAGGKVKIKYKKGSGSETEEAGIDENGEWSERVEFDKDGTYKIKFTFYDKDGKEIGDKGYYRVKIDTEDPVMGEIPSRLYKRVGDKVWWDATDDEEIDKYKYIFNGKKVKTKAPYFFIPEGTPPGVYDTEIRVYDEAKNKDIKNVLITVY